MSVEVRLPQWGMGMTDGIVVEWYVQVGDAVEVETPLVAIETAKLSGDVESPVKGTVTQVLADIDDQVDVNEVLLIIDEDE